MKNAHTKIVTAIFVLTCTLIAKAEVGTSNTIEQKNAIDIIKKSNHVSLYQGKDSKGSIKLVITDKQGRTRIREMNILRKDVDEGDNDQKYFVYFKVPADVRKMVFMVHKHSSPNKDDDRWLYLPGLDLVRRVAASDKRTSFVGSDFLYEDISGRNITEDHHEIIKETDNLYVIKNTPLRPDSVEFAYYIAFIDKQNFIPKKIEYYKSDNVAYRIMEALEIKDIVVDENGQKVVYPTVVRSIVKNLINESRSEMFYSNIKYNIGVEDKIFSERYLKRPPRSIMR